MEKEANLALRAVEGSWELDVHRGEPSHLLGIERITDCAIRGEITRYELGEIRDTMFRWSL